MIQDTWFEVGRLESLFIEIIDDPTKKEVLLYPICYCQLVRKEGSFEIELGKLLRCANKTFRSVKGEWQDILLELNLFQVKSKEGKVFSGKEILTVSQSSDYTVSFQPEYRESFQEICSKLIKYWGVLSKISSYARKNTAPEYIHILSMVFNEGLFKEATYYSDILLQRFPDEEEFWKLMRELGNFYLSYIQNNDADMKKLITAQRLVANLGEVYYSVDTGKLYRDLEKLRKNLMKGESVYMVKIELFKDRNYGRGFITRIIDLYGKMKSFLKKRGGKRWTLMNSETEFSCYTGAYLKRRRHLPIST